MLYFSACVGKFWNSLYLLLFALSALFLHSQTPNNNNKGVSANSEQFGLVDTEGRRLEGNRKKDEGLEDLSAIFGTS